MNGLSHTYTCIRPPPNSPPIQAATEHWAEFHVLYSKSLLAIHFNSSCVYIIPNSLTIFFYPLSLPRLVIISSMVEPNFYMMRQGPTERASKPSCSYQTHWPHWAPAHLLQSLLLPTLPFPNHTGCSLTSYTWEPHSSVPWGLSSIAMSFLCIYLDQIPSWVSGPLTFLPVFTGLGALLGWPLESIHFSTLASNADNQNFQHGLVQSYPIFLLSPSSVPCNPDSDYSKIPRTHHGNPFQYSCLENPMGREAWRATGHRSCKQLDISKVT